MSWLGGRSKHGHFRLSALSTLVGLLLIVGETAIAQSLGFPLITTVRAATNKATPNRFDPTSQAKSVNSTPAAPKVVLPAQSATPHPLQHSLAVSMRPELVGLSPTQSGD